MLEVCLTKGQSVLQPLSWRALGDALHIHRLGLQLFDGCGMNNFWQPACVKVGGYHNIAVRNNEITKTAVLQSGAINHILLELEAGLENNSR